MPKCDVPTYVWKDRIMNEEQFKQWLEAQVTSAEKQEQLDLETRATGDYDPMKEEYNKGYAEALRDVMSYLNPPENGEV